MHMRSTHEVPFEVIALAHYGQNLASYPDAAVGQAPTFVSWPRLDNISISGVNSYSLAAL